MQPGPNQTPLFVGGSGRSGTTMLVNHLNTHPDIAAFGETRIVEWPAVRFIDQLIAKSTGRDSVVAYLKNFLSTEGFKHEIVMDGQGQEERVYTGLHMWFELEEVQRHLPLLDSLPPAPTPHEYLAALGVFFRHLFSELPAKEGKRFWIEKTPVNALHMDALKAMFPDMKLICMIRDGRDVVSSVMKTSWAMESREAAMQWWVESVSRFFLLAESIGFERLKVIRYEDLYEGYSKILPEVLEFIGLPFSEEMLNWTPRKDGRGAWRDEWSPQDVQNYERICGNLHTQLGYALP